MESWRRQYLGLETVPASLTPAEIEFFFAPSEHERSFIGNRRQPLTRLGLILQIGFLRMTGRPLAQIERLPAAVLACAAAHAGTPAPRIATLRSINRRRMTLFQHQRIALEALGFQKLPEHAARKLTAHLRRQATLQLERADLVQDARVWLYDRGYVLLGARPLEEMAAAAQLHALEALAAGIRAVVGSEVTGVWASQLSGAGPRQGEAQLDWLRAPPAGYGRRDIGDVQDRIAALRHLGADRIVIPDLTIDRTRQHARRIARRKATTLSRLREPRRTVEIGCWLRLQLLELTDTVLEQADRPALEPGPPDGRGARPGGARPLSRRRRRHHRRARRCEPVGERLAHCDRARRRAVPIDAGVGQPDPGDPRPDGGCADTAAGPAPPGRPA